MNVRPTPPARPGTIGTIVNRGRAVGDLASGFELSERAVRTRLSREQATGQSGLENRSSRRCTVVSALSGFCAEMQARWHREYWLTVEEVARRAGPARSTVASWLVRMGLGRLCWRQLNAQVRRERRGHPGELPHLGIEKLDRLEGVRHRLTDNRRAASQRLRCNLLHVAVDDASRLADVELLADERPWSITGFLVRVAALAQG